MDQTEQTSKYPNLSKKWQTRFEFFDKHGVKRTPEYKKALDEMNLLDSEVIRFNWIAFFFGVIYFFILGLWRKGLIILIGAGILNGLIITIVETMRGDPLIAVVLNFILAFATASVYALTANRAYYLHKVKGSESANPFE